MKLWNSSAQNNAIKAAAATSEAATTVLRHRMSSNGGRGDTITPLYRDLVPTTNMPQKMPGADGLARGFLPPPSP